MAKTAWRVLQWGFGLLVVGLALRALIRNWDDLRQQTIHLEPRPLYLLASVLVVWLMYAILIWAWRMMLASWGQELSPLPAARIWTV